MSAPRIINPATAGGGVPVGGSGAAGYVAKWTAATTLGGSTTTGATASLYVDATGNVGIGTASALSERLQVVGGIRVAGAANVAAAITSTPGVLSFEFPVTRIYSGDGTGYSFAISKRSGSVTTDMLSVLDNTGNVGIGPASPTDRLTISGGGIAITGNITGAATAANSLVMDNTGGTSRFYSIGASAAAFGNYVFNASKSGGSPGAVVACTIDQAAGVLLGPTATAVFNASTSGQGVKLATTPANTDPNTLDAYFEAPAAATAGTGWTPTLSAAGTWGGVLPVVTYARYVRVGSIVFVHVQLSGAALTVAAFGGATISMPTGIAINTYANQGVVTTNTDNGASGTGVAGAGNIYSPAFAACTRATFQFFYFTN